MSCTLQNDQWLLPEVDQHLVSQHFKLKYMKNGWTFLWAFSGYENLGFVAICSWFHPFLSNCLRMRAFWKKVFKNLFLELGRKMWFSEKRQKLLYFDKALWPNHLTYSKPLGISGKTMSISFIWYPGIWNLSSHWVTVALWKWWPLKGSGRKWVIRPYPLACPCK